VSQSDSEIAAFAGLNRSISIAAIVSFRNRSNFEKCRCYCRPKALSVFRRGDECLDHFGLLVIAVELIQLLQPEIVASVVAVRRIVWVAVQVSEVLHQHKRAVELSRVKVLMFGDLSQGLRAGSKVRRVKGVAKQIN